MVSDVPAIERDSAMKKIKHGKVIMLQSGKSIYAKTITDWNGSIDDKGNISMPPKDFAEAIQQYYVIFRCAKTESLYVAHGTEVQEHGKLRTVRREPQFYVPASIFEERIKYKQFPMYGKKHECDFQKVKSGTGSVNIRCVHCGEFPKQDVKPKNRKLKKYGNK